MKTPPLMGKRIGIIGPSMRARHFTEAIEALGAEVRYAPSEGGKSIGKVRTLARSDVDAILFVTSYASHKIPETLDRWTGAKVIPVHSAGLARLQHAAMALA